MSDIDYVLLSAAVAGLVVLMFFSQRARIIVMQSVLRPTANGHLVISEAGVAYQDDQPSAHDQAPPNGPATDEREHEAPADAAKAT